MNAETERRGRSPVYGCYVNSLLLPDEIHYEPDEFFVAGELSHPEAIADVICWLSEMYNSTLLDFNSLSWESRHILNRFQLKRVGRLTIACSQQCRKRFPLSIPPKLRLRPERPTQPLPAVVSRRADADAIQRPGWADTLRVPSFAFLT